MPRRPALRALAERKGILPEYRDTAGVRRATSHETWEALLAGMGIAAADEAAARRALERLNELERAQPLDPTRVVERGRAAAATVPVRLPAGASGWVEWEVRCALEDGTVHGAAGRCRVRRGQGRLSVPLPVTPGPGYHTVELSLEAGGTPREARQLLVVSPGACRSIVGLLGRRRAFGIVAHLYTLRSERDWGVGDLTDLRALAAWARAEGAAFVAVNPLHAIRNRGGDVSPYSPLSRLYRNPLYLDPTAVPEFSRSPEARALVESDAFRATLRRLRAAEHVSYEQVMALKRPLLEALHRRFRTEQERRPDRRGRAYRTFVQREGEALRRFATFQTLEQRLGPPWQRWPAELRDPGSAAVERFRREQAGSVDFHCWLQFELDRQLEAATAAAGGRGELGLLGDLALGSAADGCDPWAFPGLFVGGVFLGAPPDDYAAEGQVWGLPPVAPGPLAQGGYHYWIRLLRSAMAHVGALRLDHVMGLFRQFWIPAGRPASQGAYVRYPARALLGILALESERHGVVIVGEDLGTVPPALSAALRRWGILSTRVLYFERERGGGFRSSRRYSKRAFVTATTHDHPPLAGFWQGRDLELCRRAAVIRSDAALAQARAARERDRRALARRLTAEGVGDPGMGLAAAVYAFLAKTPAPLLGVALDDLTGETEPLNLPGVGLDRYPSWSRRLRLPLGELARRAEVREVLRGLERRRVPEP